MDDICMFDLTFGQPERMEALAAQYGGL